MQLSFYDASIMCYEQILQSTSNVLKAGREHAEANDMPLSAQDTGGMCGGLVHGLAGTNGEGDD